MYTDDEMEGQSVKSYTDGSRKYRKLRRIGGRGQQSLGIYIKQSLPKDGPHT